MKSNNKLNLSAKLALIGALVGFSVSGFAHIFHTSYDPYYGYEKEKHYRHCIRPAYAKLDNCCAVRSIGGWKRVHSISSFTREELSESRLPYQPVSHLYVNWFNL